MQLPIRNLRFRPLALSLLALAALWLFYLDTRSTGVFDVVSNRMRFHAIPVALSQLYHGRPHDYTAHRSIALPFQGDRPLQELLDQFARPGTPVEGTYFWAADDRGLSDFVVGAFTLFGPRVHSLGKFAFLLVVLSSLLYVLAWRRDATALALLVLTLCGVAVLGPVLVIAAHVASLEGVFWRESVGLSESRIFDLLSFVAFLHLIVLCVRRRPLSTVGWLATLAQTALFVFLYHARSSLGWQVLALAVIATFTALRAVCRSPRPQALRCVVRPLLPFGILALGLVGLTGYQHATYHPRYFQDLGRRTFWHNALMGFSHPRLVELYGSTPDDRVIVGWVIDDMRRRNDPRLTADWTVDNAMCSLGSHTTFDWATYEQVARALYWRIWTDHPVWALSNYLYYKPVGVLWQVGQAAWPVALGRMGPGADDFRYNPFRPWVLALVFSTLLLLRGREHTLAGAFRTKLLLVLPFSLIPSVAFYPALPTLLGFLMVLSLGSYLALAELAGLVRRCMRLAVRRSPVVQTD